MKVNARGEHTGECACGHHSRERVRATGREKAAESAAAAERANTAKESPVPKKWASASSWETPGWETQGWEPQANHRSWYEEWHPQLWRKADDRFFWNKTLLADLVEPISSATSKETAQLVDLFVLPLIQGFIQIESFVNMDQDQNLPYEERLIQKIKMEYRLCLISRRSRFRLGKFH
jgi:hypothetical protein